MERICLYVFYLLLAIALTHAGFIAKLTRSSMLEQDNSEYVKLARAKGLGRWTIVFKHTFVMRYYQLLLI